MLCGELCIFVVNKLIVMRNRVFISVLMLLSACLGVAAAAPSNVPVAWHSLGSYPLLGTLAPDASAAYSRLPDVLEDSVRPDLWALGLNSAGLSVRFRSDSPRIKMRWKSRNRFGMNHMTATGIRGLDLYVLEGDSAWTTVSSARPGTKAVTETTVVADMEPGVEREYMLFLSLYDGVDSLYVGVDSATVLSLPAVGLPRRDKPVVMYGTSILQGGCATRPGMAHTNILQRMLNREVINLGFSGNARLDPEIARLMARADASCYVVDALPNCTADIVDERMADFIGILRLAHPDTPILIVESPWFPIMRFDREVADTLREKNRRLRAIYDRLSSDDKNLHYFNADNILTDPEATVDNYHLTDYGFLKFAKALRPVLEQLIRE